MSRQQRLIDLIAKRFAGNQADFARAIGRSPAVVWQYVKGHRDMGEKLARHIEAKLRLPAGYLDQPTQPPAALPSPDISPHQTLTDLLGDLAARLDQADPALREEVSRLVLRYLDHPEARTKLLRAIAQLLDGHDDPGA